MSTFKPTAAQSRAIQGATNPAHLQVPTAIAGPAGSGKTLVAAEIARLFALPSQTSLDLSGDGSNRQNVFFVTYTNALKRYVEDQLKETLGSDQGGITVLTVHTYLKEFLRNNGFDRFLYHDTPITSERGVKKREAFLRDYIEEYEEEFELTGCLADASFLDEEIGWLLGQGIRSLQVYLNTPRTGRRTRLNKQQREKVFRAFSEYMRYLKGESGRINRRLIDFDDIGNQVVHYCGEHRCNPIASHLIVDEVQDLAKTWIEALRSTTNGKIIYAGDPSQSIYGRGFTWQDITGRRIRPIHLTEDFRSTQQIYLAARSLMDFDRGSEGEIGNANQRRRNGDKPKLVFCRDRESQNRGIIELVSKLHSDDPFSTIAIATPRRECLNGIEGRCQASITTTLHSLKGLEADHVILANLDEDVFDFTNEFTQEDTNRHLLYVGMTRAKKSLTMMTATDNPAPVLFELSADYVDLDDSDNPTAHRAMLDARASKALESRENFEQLVEEKIKKDEAVEHAESVLKEANDLDDSDASNELIAKLEAELKKLRDQQRRSDERLQQQEDELRTYRARERSDEAEVGEEEVQRLPFVDNAKILILGGLGVRAKDLPGILKREGLPRDAFEYLDYDEVHGGKFDASDLLYNTKYSDVFVSTTPHKAKGIGDASSLVEYLEENGNCVPKLTVFRAEDGTLKKASRTELKIALRNSALYAAKRGI